MVNKLMRMAGVSFLTMAIIIGLEKIVPAQSPTESVAINPKTYKIGKDWGSH